MLNRNVAALAFAMMASGAANAADAPVKPILERYSAAWAKGDAAALAKLFTPDGQAMSAGVAVDGEAAIRGLYAAAFAGGPSTIVTHIERVRGIGPRAAIGRGVARITPRGGPPACLRFLTTLEQTSSGWRISALADQPASCADVPA